MNNENVQTLVDQVIAGTATEAEVGMALKSLKNQLSVTLIQSLSQSYRSIINFNELLNDAIRKFNDKYNESSEVLDMQTLMEYINTIQNKQLQLMDILRKTVQGKELFDADVMSEDEKRVLKLFRTFKSSEDKRRFMDIVRRELGEE